jgi:hypothetical protein
MADIFFRAVREPPKVPSRTWSILAAPRPIDKALLHSTDISTPKQQLLTFVTIVPWAWA